MEKSISTGLKVWLWIVIVLNGLSVISNLTKIGSNPFGSIVSIVLEAVMIYACIMIMFQMKKLGFKLMVIMAVVNAVFSVIASVIGGIAAGAITGSAAVGIAGGVIAAIFTIIIAAICPLVTYLLMKKDWDMFE